MNQGVAERPRRYGPDTVAQVEQQSRASSISSATYGSPGASGVEAGAHQLQHHPQDHHGRQRRLRESHLLEGLVPSRPGFLDSQEG
jgi:hypothetical protein